MKVAIEGCAHGDLEKIYDTIQYIEKRENIKVDLLLCCGDFQAVRNEADLQCMAVPPKYREMCSFYKYYSGEKTAPILTIFIGGNHEASNYLAELPYGGWVCPNIYYMGYAGVVNIGGLRIGGLSGIYKKHDYKRGHYEKAPFSQESMRSVYHIRNLEVFRLKQMKQPLDIMMSHDWPRGIYHYGNIQQLLRRKPFMQAEVESNQLGSPPAEELLHALKPSYWFSAHLHIKFPAVVQHKDDSKEENDGKGSKVTKFLALDKCLPRRDFLQIIDIPKQTDSSLELSYDAEWLAILKSTNHLLNTTPQPTNMPFPGLQQRFDFAVTEEELDVVRKDLNGDFKLPNNFVKTAPSFNPQQGKNIKNARQPTACVNPQTTSFCELIGITDPNDPSNSQKRQPLPDKMENPDEISLDDDDDDDDDDDESDSETVDDDTNDDVISPEESQDDDIINEQTLKSASEESTEAKLSDFSDELFSPIQIETSQSDDSIKRTQLDEPCQKGAKKFKRRNQAIYDSKDESDDD
ncbi:uncharacterized protein LOC144447620 [Glandiceps talaboti]